MFRILVLCLLALSVPHQTMAATQGAKPLVVASFSLLADMAQTIGGDAVTVESLVGPDQDAHVFQPSARDVKKVAKAALVLSNGLGFEGWMDRLIQSTGFKGVYLVASKGVVARNLEENEVDPHAWQDISNARIYAKNIAISLQSIAPDQANDIEKRAKAYDEVLAKLDAKIRDSLRTIPRENRKIITSHDAFGYFGSAYGVTFFGAPGTIDGIEPSAKQVAALIRQIRVENVRQVFIENMSNPKLITQIAKDSGATMGGTLYADALTNAGGDAPTYVAMMEINAKRLLAALSDHK